MPRARSAEIVLTNKTVLSRDVIAALPRLKCICVLATGYNVVDVAAAKERGVTVCNVPEYSTPNVAQAVFALLLELTNRTGHHDRTVHEGRWAACEDFCYWDGELVELAAVCLQHEMDHLEGKLFVDYLSSLKRDRIRRKLEKDRKARATSDAAPVGAARI